MGAWRGALMTGLALTSLDLLVQPDANGNATNASKVGGIFTSVTGLLAKFFDPTVPGIPQTASASSTTTTAATAPADVAPSTVPPLTTTPSAPSGALV